MVDRPKEVELPDGWEKINHLCYPRRGSKAFKKSTTGENLHIVNLYNSGLYNVNAVSSDGETLNKRIAGYNNAVEVAESWMNNREG